MIIRRIKNCTRVCGQRQGFLGLPIRDERVVDKVVGDCNAMNTAWEPTPDELAALNAGASVVVRILGNMPSPMMVLVEDSNS